MFKEKQKIDIPYIAVAICLTLFIIFIVSFFQKKHVAAHKSTVEQELKSISEVKIGEINRWRNERLQLAESIKNNEALPLILNKWFSNPLDANLKTQIIQWLKLIKEAQDSHGVYTLDSKGSVSLFVCDKRGKLSDETLGLLEKARLEDRVIFSDLHRNIDEGTIEIDILIPMKFNQKFIGWIILAIEPNKTLYPLIQSFPTSSATGEFILVRKDGDSVLFLNELRHKKDTALNLRIPLTQDNVPAVMAVKGVQGSVEGSDYRGVPVIAYVTSIPNSQWFLVTKIDKSEAFADLASFQYITIFTAIFLILSTILGIALAWRNQKSRFYQSQYETEKMHAQLLQKYEHLTKHANDIIFIIDSENYNIVEANERAVETYGYSLDELTSMNVRDIRSNEASKMLNGHYSKTAEFDGHLFETIHIKKNGQTFPVEVSSRVLEIDNKKFYCSIVRDITDRKKAEKKLKDAIIELRKLEDIINKSPAIAFLCKNEEGLPIEFISANISLYGYKATDLIIDKAPFMNLIAPTERNKFINKIEELNLKLSEFTLEHMIMSKSGEIKWAETKVWAIVNEDGNITHFQGVLIDISEQKKLHDQLIQAQKMEAIGQLAGGVAHDFNNILTAITGYAYMLRMRLEKDDTLCSYVDHILASSERAANLTNSLLAFSRKQIINPQPLSLNKVIKELHKLLLRLITEDIDIEMFLSDHKLTIMADKNQIEQVIINLVTNAKDAMQEGGSITIETEIVQIDEEYVKSHGYGRVGKYALLSITDTGAGMDAETQKRIFEPFFTTKEIGKGTGLGLSIVYGIVKQHNGYINVYSEINKGTTFRIYLPLVEAEEISLIKTDDTSFAMNGIETILIAEDDSEVRTLYKKTLEAYGYAVIEAEDGEEAVSLFIDNKDKIQLLILDVIMPKRNGKEAYEVIKAIKPDIKAIFTSGYTENIIHKKGILDAQLNFIRKPVSPNELLRKIRQVLDNM